MEGFKLLHISRKEKESSNITSFYLVAEDGSPLPTFKPGQYITVRVKRRMVRPPAELQSFRHAQASRISATA
ncbi:MAG: Flavohemoprotein (Hemoglobin-like protein) (Flavohemoglobin) (Nitric oxide dioxygenase) [Nitrobacter vulgaris]|jgi:ferredoxin-NADP reductase|nr:Flavohemoprotein (Hemoglobin-like protein) (Flavohemoglobin) (Nitric oxide dioxygenase) [Nitrobacter vulgaris]